MNTQSEKDDNQSKKIITDLFELFIEEPSLLPTEWSEFENKDQKLTRFVIIFLE